MRGANRGTRHPAGTDRPERFASLEPRRDALDPPCSLAAGRGVPRRRVQAWPDGAAASRSRRRGREERCDRGRVDRRKGDARPFDAAHGRVVSALRLLLARGLHHAGPFGDRARARAVTAAPPLLSGAVLPERRGSGGGPRSATRGSLDTGLTRPERYGRAVARPRNAAERRAAWWYRLR